MNKGRCFIIGTGPSLNDTPLDLLVNEATFATGRIHKVFDKTSWRPTYYVKTDREGAGLYLDELIPDLKIMLSLDCMCYLNRGWLGHYHRYTLQTITPGKVDWITTCREHTFLHSDSEGVPDSWHLPEVCGFGSSLHVAIQLAVKLGYDPIYLLGCDLDYGTKESYFDKDYTKHETFVTNDDLVLAHKIAKSSSPVMIYNCSKGGSLGTYPRIELEELFYGR